VERGGLERELIRDVLVRATVLVLDIEAEKEYED
jgi:hypothetical protein